MPRIRVALRLFALMAIASVAVIATPVQAAAPTVGSLNPNSGPEAGGTVVHIMGSGFFCGLPAAPPTGNAVSFGSTASPTVTVVSDTEVDATSPAGTGTVNVVVNETACNGASAINANDQFTYVAAAATPSPTPTPSPSGLAATSGSDGPPLGLSLAVLGIIAVLLAAGLVLKTGWVRVRLR
jgi:hypothetical protein